MRKLVKLLFGVLFIGEIKKLEGTAVFIGVVVFEGGITKLEGILKLDGAVLLAAVVELLNKLLDVELMG